MDALTSTVRWVSDDEASRCMSCEEPFSLLLRRHHCRACGSVVCDLCSKGRSRLAFLGYMKEVRVCMGCMVALDLKKEGRDPQGVLDFINTKCAQQSTDDIKRSLRDRVRALEQEHPGLASAEHHEEKEAGDSTSSEVICRYAELRQHLREERLRGGVYTCLFPPLSSSRRVWSRRLFAVCPSQGGCVVLTSVLPNNARLSSKRPVRLSLHLARPVHEISDVSIVPLGVDTSRSYSPFSSASSTKVLRISFHSPGLHASSSSTPSHTPTRLKPSSPSGTSTELSSASNSKSYTLEGDSESVILVPVSTLTRQSSSSSSTAVWHGGVEQQADVRALEEMAHSVNALRQQYFSRVQSQVDILVEHRNLMSTEVSWDSSEHAFKLQRLWETFMPDAPFEGNKSERWKEIGFQGADPQTDFRGMGVHALDCLLYLSQHYADMVQELVHGQRVDKRDYPLCAAAINCVSLIADMLGIKQVDSVRLEQQTPLFRLFCTTESHNPDAFKELFCAILRVLDKAWVVTQSTYLDFPTRFAFLRQRMEFFLERDPPSLSVFTKWLLHDAEQWTDPSVG